MHVFLLFLVILDFPLVNFQNFAEKGLSVFRFDLVIFFALTSHIVNNPFEYMKNVTPGEITLGIQLPTGFSPAVIRSSYKTYLTGFSTIVFFAN